MVSAVVAQAQAHRIDSAAPGLIEAGAPHFEVRTYQTLGLDAPPTDLHVLPDGRLLLVAGRQIAIGDGVRWERFQQSADDPSPPAATVAVDGDGAIYRAVVGGFARVIFGSDAHWRLHVVAPCTIAESGRVAFLNTVVQIGNDWFWHGDSGALVAWRPGQTARVTGDANTIEHVFRWRDAFYMSDRTSGRLWRLDGPSAEPVNFRTDISARDTVTSAVTLGPDQLLVGTYGRGLKLFDGARMLPFPNTGHLSEGARINALCKTAGGLYAAAVEGYGLVFFDRLGRMVEVIDHSLDRQLNHIQRLCTTGGAIVGLLGEGIVRVEFPSRVSYFESLAETRLSTAHPYRFAGRLWLMADGTMNRGVYDPFGRLSGFEVDSPPGRFAFAFYTVFGAPVVTTEHGAYTRTERGWIPFAQDSSNLRILEAAPRNGRWLYAAARELGWLRPTSDGIAVERFPAPDLDSPYNVETGDDGSIWIEQGNARLARVRVTGDRPTVETFGHQDGVPEGWIQVFLLDGHVGFSVDNQILRFVEATRRFEPDEQFARDFPGLTNIVGRPIRDALGRVWITANGSVQVLAGERGHWRNLGETMPPGFQPYYFTCESNGVVWMHSDRRLARFDPSLPPAPALPFHALITDLSFSNSGRTEFSFGRELPPIEFGDGSFAVRFVAPNCPFGVSVDFEVKLEGADSRWASAGAAGSTVFNHLKEGRYVFHVRPRAAGETGEEATLAFTVLPPWFRAPWAYVGYVIGVAGLLVLIARVTLYLEHREKVRLERLVEERTQELNAGIERRRRLEAQLQQSQKLESLGTLAGGIAHDFNNLLTSILGYCELAGISAGDNTDLQADLQEIRTAGLRARDLVAQILTFSRQHNVTLVPIDLSEPVADALKLVRASMPATIEIVVRLTSGIVRADATQIHQVVVNLCNNAAHAMRNRPGRLEISLDRMEVTPGLAAEVPHLEPGSAMRLMIADTGSGMDAALLERIFDPFFTTKPPGEGTGLGLAIVQGIVRGHQGGVRVHSVPGSGTTFELFFPVTTASTVVPSPADAAPLGQGEEILVVDDERSVVIFVEQRLSQLGYRPTVFSDPRAALAAVVATPRRFQAIVTDLTMPGLTGEELIEQCRAAGANLPAVIITGYGADALKNLPRCAMIAKPFKGDDLVRALAGLLGRNNPS
jgi:signal transduction histidine kinase/CheY-like chemotaxis protein/streptogramin lyase